MKQNFDFNLAAIFIKVVEHKSITKAAEKLGMPKATVSRKLSQLEDTLGIRLMQRTTRKLSLTDAGRQYFEACRDAIESLHEANANVAQYQREPSGELRVTAPVVFGDQFLSEPLIEFMRQYPDVKVRIELTDRLVDLVDEAYDVAFRVGQLTDSSYVARRLGPTRQMIVAAPSYLKRYGCPQHPKELKHHRLIGYSETLKNVLRFRGTDGEVSLSPEAHLFVNSLNVMRAVAEAGLGITILPSFVAIPSLKTGRLAVILPEWQFVFGDMYLVYPSRRHVPAKTRVFVEFMVEYYSAHRPWLADENTITPFIHPLANTRS